MASPIMFDKITENGQAVLVPKPQHFDKDGKPVETGKNNPLPTADGDVESRLSKIEDKLDSVIDDDKVNMQLTGSNVEKPLPIKEVGDNVSKITTKIYDEGTEYIEFIEGYSLRTDDGVTKESDHIYLSAKSEGSGAEASIESDELIDFSDFSKIKIKCEFVKDGEEFASFNVFASQNKKERMGPGGEYAYDGGVTELNHLEDSMDDTIEIDVTGLKGEYYLGINSYASAHSSSTLTSNVKIYNITTESQSLYVSMVGESTTSIRGVDRNGNSSDISVQIDDDGYGVLRTFQSTPIEQTEEIHDKLDTMINLLEGIKNNAKDVK